MSDVIKKAEELKEQGQAAAEQVQDMMNQMPEPPKDANGNPIMPPHGGRPPMGRPPMNGERPEPPKEETEAPEVVKPGSSEK